MAAPDPTPSTCPRCGGGFDCGAQAGRCDCFDIRLDEAQRAAVAERFDGCLCLGCLRAIVQGEAVSHQPRSLPDKPPQA
jgi:hypothetical protein